MPGLAEADKPRKRVVYALSNPYNTRARDPGGPGQTVRTEQTGEEPRLLRTNVSCIAALCAGFVVGYR